MKLSSFSSFSSLQKHYGSLFFEGFVIAMIISCIIPGGTCAIYDVFWRSVSIGVVYILTDKYLPKEANEGVKKGVGFAIGMQLLSTSLFQKK